MSEFLSSLDIWIVARVLWTLWWVLVIGLAVAGIVWVYHRFQKRLEKKLEEVCDPEPQAQTEGGSRNE